MLPEQVEVCADRHLRPYYGDEDETDGIYHSEAKRGTTAFYAYATLYTRVTNKRYTLAVRRLVDGNTASSVLAEFLELLDGIDVTVETDAATASTQNSGSRTSSPRMLCEVLIFRRTASTIDQNSKEL